MVLIGGAEERAPSQWKMSMRLRKRGAESSFVHHVKWYRIFSVSVGRKEGDSFITRLKKR
jgi:hypothetical protein